MAFELVGREPIVGGKPLPEGHARIMGNGMLAAAKADFELVGIGTEAVLFIEVDTIRIAIAKPSPKQSGAAVKVQYRGTGNQAIGHVRITLALDRLGITVREAARMDAVELLCKDSMLIFDAAKVELGDGDDEDESNSDDGGDEGDGDESPAKRGAR